MNANLIGAFCNDNTIIHDIDVIRFVQYMKSVRDQDSRAIRQRSS